jgi:kynurenine formamidase
VRRFVDLSAAAPARTQVAFPAGSPDEPPLEWFFAPGVMLDLTRAHDPAAISEEEVGRALHDIRHALQPLEIVLLRTGGAAAGACGLAATAARYLRDRGVRVTGADAMGEGESAPGVAPALPLVQIAPLRQLDALPPDGFEVSAFPVPAGGDARTARVVAIW